MFDLGDKAGDCRLVTSLVGLVWGRLERMTCPEAGLVEVMGRVTATVQVGLLTSVADCRPA